MFPVDGYENGENMWELLANLMPQNGGAINLPNYGSVAYFGERQKQQALLR